MRKKVKIQVNHSRL